MQTNYSYELVRDAGDVSDYPLFQPFYTPYEMLELGVFEGKYLDPHSSEYPSYYLSDAKLSHTPNIRLNLFQAKSRQPLSVWRANGWINAQDPRGWFEWYCRFWLGRRTADDTRQIARWYSFGARHGGQILANCPCNGDQSHPNAKLRPRQRQGLLQWSHNPWL